MRNKLFEKWDVSIGRTQCLRQGSKNRLFLKNWPYLRSKNEIFGARRLQTSLSENQKYDKNGLSKSSRGGNPSIDFSGFINLNLRKLSILLNT